MRRALATVVEDEGTAKLARSEGYPVAGKTGTNHKVVKGRYMRDKGNEQYITSFAGFCPVEEPDFVCIVVMDNPAPRKVYDEKIKDWVEFKRGGGSVAAPIFSRLVTRIAPLRGVKQILVEEEKKEEEKKNETRRDR
jgi:cell division protein FtsI/penicillin-binding protein 2